MPRKSPDTSGSSITHWSVGAKEAKASDLSAILVEKSTIKARGLKFLEEHHLPRYKKKSVHLSKFLLNPTSFFSKFVSKTGFYYSSIVDLDTGERMFGLEQSQQEVIDFLKAKLASKEINYNSQLTLSEYWHNYYGGNLLINKRGEVYVELVEGKHAKLPKGEGQILLSAKTEQFTGILNFDIHLSIDQAIEHKLRQAVGRVIDLIPKQLVALSQNPISRFKEKIIDDAGEMSVAIPYSGYYEFILTKKKPEDKDWRIIFIDARTGAAAEKYQLLD